jgi:tetratricopeptide (TPR) repeat protein
MKRLTSFWLSLLFVTFFARAIHGQETNRLDAGDLIQRGQDELTAGRWDEAESFFRSATQVESTNSKAYAGWGYALLRLDRPREAIAAYRQALDLDPGRTNTWLYLGEAYESLEGYPKAVESYRKYISLNDRNDRAYQRLYYSLSRLRRFGEAEEACRRAIAINPTNSVYRVSLGYCLQSLGRYSEANQSLKKAISLDPQNSQAYHWLGISRYHEKAYQEAIASFQKSILLRPTNSESEFWLGRSFAALDRYDEAARAFQDAIQIDPRDTQSYEWRAVSLLRIGRFDEAAATFEQAFAVRSNDKTIRRSLFCCYLLSSQYEKAYRLYPVIFTLVGSTLLLSYLIGLTALLRSSLRVSSDTAPRLGFSLAWLILFLQGQIALIFCLALLSWINISENLLFGITLAGIPVIVAAARGFVRQPWGQPFSWPPRLGTAKVMGLSLLGLVVTLGLGPWCARWIEHLLHRPPTIQEAIPLIKYALVANPLAAFSAVVIVGPIVEEILFRGLIYGALEKRFRATGAIVISSLLFALVHLQVVYFIPIFCLGSVLGWARSRTNSLGLSILIHVLNNGAALIVLKFFEKS